MITFITWCSRPRVGKTELKGLVGKSPPRAGPDMGSIALLSPVRADGRLTNQLGAVKVPHVTSPCCTEGAVMKEVSNCLRKLFVLVAGALLSVTTVAACHLCTLLSYDSFHKTCLIVFKNGCWCMIAVTARRKLILAQSAPHSAHVTLAAD